MRTGTGCGKGFAVRPASDSVTVTPGRLASASASSLASIVPPRIRMRLVRAEQTMPDPAPPKRWLSIVGIGEDGVEGLSPVARGLVAGADIVFGGERHLKLAASVINGESKRWPSPFSGAVGEVLAASGRQVCVLASGDPLQYGVGSLLAAYVSPDE